jgi:hypothetical protein
MAIQTINIGNIVNDGLGDDLRTAFQKVNGNFAELSASLTVTASNLLGEELEGNIFKQKTNNNLEFKTLVAGQKIQFISDPDSITILSTVPDAFIEIETDEGTVRAENNQFLKIQGTLSPSRYDAQNIVVTNNVNSVFIDTKLPINDIFKVLDFGYINELFDNVLQFNTALANIDFGTIINPSSINVDLGVFNN